jgi:hypothetical protein
VVPTDHPTIHTKHWLQSPMAPRKAPSMLAASHILSNLAVIALSKQVGDGSCRTTRIAAPKPLKPAFTTKLDLSNDLAEDRHEVGVPYFLRNEPLFRVIRGS